MMMEITLVISASHSSHVCAHMHTPVYCAVFRLNAVLELNFSLKIKP